MQTQRMLSWLHGDRDAGAWDGPSTLLTHSQRAALAWVLVPAMTVMAVAWFGRHVPDLVNRAYLTEAALMLRHARHEVMLERALRPAKASEPVGALEILGLKHEDSAMTRILSLRYERQGDRLLAHFSKNGDTGLWTLEPVEQDDATAWVQNWRCVARSSGRLGAIAQHFCPGQLAPDAP